MNLILIIILVLFFPFIILLNIIIYRYIINSALRKYILTALQSKNLNFVRWKWAGLFSSGDFPHETMNFRAAFKNGSAWQAIYVFIYYQNADVEKKLTVRVDTFMLFIRKVVYSDESFNN